MSALSLFPDQPLASPLTGGVIYWFRHDLLLHDQPALGQAAALAGRLNGWLLPIYVHDQRLQAPSPWGFQRAGPHRRAWTGMAVHALAGQLGAIGSVLLQSQGDPVELLTRLVRALGDPVLVCEEIAAPEEQAQVEALLRRGVRVRTLWQSTLMTPEALPWPSQEVPDRFTTFRQILERQGVRAAPALPALRALPAPPPAQLLRAARAVLPPAPEASASVPLAVDPRSAFPWDQPAFHGGESAALAHLAKYCCKGLPHTYKLTRNGLDGVEGSSKWSPWLATGALSARTAWAAIEAFEAEHGANESTYWLGFELLWRDHFRWLHCKHGHRLYRAQGLTDRPAPAHDGEAFRRWCNAATGDDFIDAGMRELAATGYLSNRMRQNVASYLIHDLGCDWRAGAAWFEAQLIDYDVCSNQGNWLYLSGRGTDPRPNRRFNTRLQAQTFDPEGRYRRKWSA